MQYSLQDTVDSITSYYSDEPERRAVELARADELHQQLIVYHQHVMASYAPDVRDQVEATALHIIFQALLIGDLDPIGSTSELDEPNDEGVTAVEHIRGLISWRIS